MSNGFNGPLPPDRFNMAEYCLGTPAAATPEAVGLIVLGGPLEDPVTERWTFGALDRAARAIGNGLTTYDLARGDRVMLRLGNTSSYALLFFGCLGSGFVALPTSSMLSEAEALTMVEDARVAAVAHVGGQDNTSQTAISISAAQIQDWTTSKNAVQDYADTAADEPAFLVYTSGTTSRPKGVLHAHRAAWGRRPMYRDWYGITSADRLLHAGAFNWTYTLGTGLTDPWANGATAIINTQPRTPDAWPALIRGTEATIFAAVPSLYRQILKYAPPGPIDIGDLRHGLTAGETLPASVAKEWFERTGTRLHEALGMSEISTYISACPDRPAPSGTVGFVQSGRSVAILPKEHGTQPLGANETGQLAIHRSDPGLMLDYWNRPDEREAVFRGEWFMSGDLASIDEDGAVRHHGRVDDLMNAFGYRVSPLEVEHVIGRTDGVAEVAVTEINVRDGLSVIGAFVVADADDLGSLRHNIEVRVARDLADYKRPREYVFVAQLPRTANGKLQRSALQILFDQRTDTQ